MYSSGKNLGQLTSIQYFVKYVNLGKITHTEYCQLGEDLERIG